MMAALAVGVARRAAGRASGWSRAGCVPGGAGRGLAQSGGAAGGRDPSDPAEPLPQMGGPSKGDGGGAEERDEAPRLTLADDPAFEGRGRRGAGRRGFHTSAAVAVGLDWLPQSSLAVPERLDDAQLDAFEDRIRGIHRRRIKVPSSGARRRAGVLVPLCTLPSGEPALLFTKRTDQVGSHRGEVSFPGGMVEDGDDTIVTTALRETAEELGVHVVTPRERLATPIATSGVELHARVLGRLHDCRSITDIAVTPVVAYLGPLPANLDEIFARSDEVADIFTVPLADLAADDKRHTQTGARGEMPVFDGGRHRIWGLTAFITWEALRILLRVRSGDGGAGRAALAARASAS